MIEKKQIKSSIAALLLSISVSSQALDVNQYPELSAMADRLVAEKVYGRQEIERLFAGVKLNSKVVSAFKRPAEKLTWGKYRGLFITDSVVQNGVKFWRQHRQILERAAQQYGVPVEIIVAITGVETRFGTNKGKHSVLNSLTTLSLQFERRKEFFRSELESYLRLVKSENLSPTKTVGSYAGAMGIPQFIASSYNAYAVDFDDNGSRDLINSYADAVGSVANYFRQHGWLADKPITARLTNIKPEQFEKFKQTGKSATHTVADLRAAGVQLPEQYADELAADVIKLNNKDATEYWLVFENFYVIKRYNHSNLYAMAVTQLSQAIKRKYQP